MLTLVSSNIRFDNPKDGPNRWRNRRPVLATILNDLAPDAIATQEGWHGQILDIAGDLPEYDLADDHRDWIEERMYPCVFYRRGALVLLDSGDIWLSTTPNTPGSSSFGSAFPRLATWARFSFGGERYLICNMHLDNSTGEIRRKQSEVARQALTGIRRGDEYLILLGDFNEAPAGGVSRTLASMAELYDPWADAALAETGTYHAFAGEEFQYDRIDWLLLDARLTFDEIALERRQIQGRYPSDHYPLVCRGVRPR